MDTLGLSNCHIVPFNSKELELSTQSYITVHLVLRVLLHILPNITLVSFLCQEHQTIVKNSATEGQKNTCIQESSSAVLVMGLSLH